MAFFNKKQEVLDIQLTPYGEDLLSRGKFKPEYYAFFDDDILYDATGSAGIKEHQNDVEPRIQDETPKSKVQYVFSGPEKRTTERIRQAWEEIGSIEIGGLWVDRCRPWTRDLRFNTKLPRSSRT